MAKKGVAEILIEINEKGTKKLKGISDAFGGMVKSGAKVGIALGVVGTAIGKLALDADKFEGLKKSFSELAKSQGVDSRKLLKDIKNLTKGTVAEIDILKNANQAMLLGLPIDRFDEMVNIARGASRATGQSMEFMLESITTGLGRQSKLILDNLGIVIKLEDAYIDYAKSLDKTAKELTEAEKKQAFINAAIDKGNENLEKMGGLQPTVTDQWESFKAVLKDTTISLGQNAIPIFSVFIDTVADIGKGFKSLVDSNQARVFFRDVSLFIISAKEVVVDFIDDLISIPDWLMAAAGAAKAAIKLDFDSAIKIMKNHEKERNKLAKVNTEKRAKEAEKIINDFNKREIRNRERTEIEKKDIAIELAQVRNQIQIEDAKDAAEQEKSQAVEIKKQQLDEQLDLFRIAEENYHDIHIVGEEKRKQDALKVAQETADKRAAILAQEAEANRQSMLDISNTVQTFTTSGFEGVAKSALSTIADSFLPGVGGAVAAVFDLLSMETDDFNKQLDKMFSVDFVENIATNFMTFIERLPELIGNLATFIEENAPEIIRGLIRAIIGGMPEIVSALAKAFGDPKFIAEIGHAVLMGVKEGWQDSIGDITKAIRKAVIDAGTLKIKVDTGTGKVSTGGGGKNDSSKWWWTPSAFSGAPSIPEVSLPFAHGGPIPGYNLGGMIDNTLIRATPGEFVVNRASAQANAGLLEAINSSRGNSVNAGSSINIVVNGGLLGDKDSAREFALAVDEELTRLRLGNESNSFDVGIA